MNTIGDAVSRLRSILKAVNEDSFITDRMLYTVILKYAKLLIKRDDDRGKIIRMSSIYSVLPCIELIEVDKIEACCSGIKTNCIVMRTKDKLPKILDATYGPMFRSITSIDGSISIIITDPGTYTSMTKTSTFKYNKSVYCWIINDYIYIPNQTWEAIKVEAIFEGNIGAFQCDSQDQCIPRQEQNFNVPDYLFAEIEQFALKELTAAASIPGDGQDDKQNILR